MEVTKENIYKLIAGTLGENPKTFNIDADLVKIYKMDSLSILDMALVIEDHTGYYVTIPDDALATLKTARQYADYVMEQYNVPN